MSKDEAAKSVAEARRRNVADVGIFETMGCNI